MLGTCRKGVSPGFSTRSRFEGTEGASAIRASPGLARRSGLIPYEGTEIYNATTRHRAIWLYEVSCSLSILHPRYLPLPIPTLSTKTSSWLPFNGLPSDLPCYLFPIFCKRQSQVAPLSFRQVSAYRMNLSFA